MQKKLHFIKTGTSEQVVILFHGFGQTNESFSLLISEMASHCTVYAFDLYYHGESIREDRHLSLDEWRHDFKTFLKAERITRFSVVGFSLGGRFAIATGYLFATQVQKIILIAPDGIYKNFWYLFATSRAGNWLFRYMMHHPDKFDVLLTYFERWKLASPSMLRFARKELADKANCLRVYRSWTFFRSLQLNPKAFSTKINQHNAETHIILGEKDFIIPVTSVLPKLSTIDNLHIHMYPDKHHHLVDRSRNLLLSIFSINRENDLI